MRHKEEILSRITLIILTFYVHFRHVRKIQFVVYQQYWAVPTIVDSPDFETPEGNFRKVSIASKPVLYGFVF